MTYRSLANPLGFMPQRRAWSAASGRQGRWIFTGSAQETLGTCSTCESCGLQSPEPQGPSGSDRTLARAFISSSDQNEMLRMPFRCPANSMIPGFRVVMSFQWSWSSVRRQTARSKWLWQTIRRSYGDNFWCRNLRHGGITKLKDSVWGHYMASFG